MERRMDRRERERERSRQVGNFNDRVDLDSRTPLAWQHRDFNYQQHNQSTFNDRYPGTTFGIIKRETCPDSSTRGETKKKKFFHNNS